ncbi:hypothetical protein [Granulicella arctica]|uniref:hypothetical protein n=1 Tax=Granulicella arctica TaxID=940613 RepID=UPI0021DF4B9E|nr:hypothetical protein [Granulicella arctica]
MTTKKATANAGASPLHVAPVEMAIIFGWVELGKATAGPSTSLRMTVLFAG